MRVEALAPAKINLGLEVLGRRSDGFHEIRTIMAAVSLFDRLTVSQSRFPRFHVDQPDLSAEPNLVEAAVSLVREQDPTLSAQVSLRKRIPTAAGLGGASSDAAAALIALDRCFVLDSGKDTLLAGAARLGSDVPFFVAGGRALVSGRGEVITQLQPASGLCAVIVAPHIQIPAKTVTLYRALTTADFTDGSRVETASKTRSGEFGRDASTLRNAFERPLYAFVPDLSELPDLLRACGASVVALSGAGPAHYSLEADLERAHSIAANARGRIGKHAKVHVVKLISHGILLSVEDEGPEDMPS